MKGKVRVVIDLIEKESRKRIVHGNNRKIEERITEKCTRIGNLLLENECKIQKKGIKSYLGWKYTE